MSSPWKNLAKSAAGLIEQYGDTIAPNLFDPVCDSPIEVVFGASFHLLCALNGTPLQVLSDLSGDMGNGPFLVPQYVIGRYRADFLIGIGGNGPRLSKCIVVECDGHDFHEKTKDQAARDKSRDRDMMFVVAKVIRFTGSELHARPFECADDAWELMAQVHTGFPS